MSSFSLASNPGSMVDEVPVEIMRQIFEYCIAREGIRPKAEGQAQGTSLFTSVYTLCLVCSSWKDIAMGHPPLWSTVVIRAELAKSEHSSKDIQVLQVQVFYIGRLLARISSFPWSLYIHLGHSPSLQQPSPLVHADSNYIVQPNFSESGPRFPLWTSLPRTSLATLKLLHIFTPVRWPHLENLELPNLESLVVEVNINLASDFENGDLPSLPRLVKLAVIGMPFFMFPSTVPWSQLTHLHLEVEMMFMEDLEKILLKSAHLREASFKVPDVHGVLPRLSARVPGNGSLEPLTRLKGITFSAFYPDLTNISWPNLNYLRLTESDIQRIPASLQKLSSLTHLEFSCRRIETPLEPFIKVIDACPLLVRLILDTRSLMDQPLLFQSLVFDPLSSKPRLQHLEELGITCTVRRQPTWEIIGNAPSAYSDLEQLLDSRTKDYEYPMKTCARLKILAIRISRGREYNPIAKRVERILRSFEGRLAEWHVIRSPGLRSTFEGIFEPWGDGVLDELVRPFGFP